MITSRDFARLRWSVLLLALCSLLGAAAIFLTLSATQDADKSFKIARNQRSEIQGKLARANDEETEIRKKIGLYRQIESRGLIGVERRLEWVETIAQIKSARRLIDIQYELSPQKPIEALVLPGGPVGGGHEFMVSSMKLQMQLLHEEDLTGFLADLAGRVQAHLLVRGCQVERVPSSATGGRNERGSSPQLKADCTIDWITLREKK